MTARGKCGINDPCKGDSEIDYLLKIPARPSDENPAVMDNSFKIIESVDDAIDMRLRS